MNAGFRCLAGKRAEIGVDRVERVLKCRLQSAAHVFRPTLVEKGFFLLQVGIEAVEISVRVGLCIRQVILQPAADLQYHVMALVDRFAGRAQQPAGLEQLRLLRDRIGNRRSPERIGPALEQRDDAADDAQPSWPQILLYIVSTSRPLALDRLRCGQDKLAGLRIPFQRHRFPPRNVAGIKSATGGRVKSMHSANH